MYTEQEQLVGLLHHIESKEAKKKKRFILVTILPIMLALILLCFFSVKILHSKEQVNKLNVKVDSLNNVLTIYNKRIDSITKFYNSLEFNFVEDFGWTAKDVIGKDSLKIIISQRSHQKIIELLKAHKVNVNTVIRYYTKKTDKGKINRTLLKCGFRIIKEFTGSYYGKNQTNVITYSSDVPDENIKVIAFSLLRAGISLKAVEPFSKEIQKRKYNSIEISGKPELDSNPDITIEDINNFNKKEQ